MHITNNISRVFGKFAKQEFPPFLQNFINKTYVKLLGLDMREFEEATYYKSLNALFTRELKYPRQIDTSNDNFISSADSFITACGKIEIDTSLQIKGMSYSVQDLLTPYTSIEDFKKIQNGFFMNFYLSPKDYHRYHASIDCKIVKLIHVPGKLYPVNLKYLNKKLNLFVENERVILECLTKENKLFYMIFVGALNVGQMVFEFEPSVETNKNTKTINVVNYDNLEVKKGDC